MSQKSSGREINGKLLTPEDQRYLDGLRSQMPTGNMVDLRTGATTPSTPERHQQFIQTETDRLDKKNRSRQSHNRLVRFGQVASVAPFAAGFAPGGAFAAGGLGGGGGAATGSSMGGLATGAPASATVPTGTLTGGTLAATPFTAVTPYAGAAQMMSPAAYSAATGVANAAGTIGSMGVGSGGPGAGVPVLASSGVPGSTLPNMATAGSNMTVPSHMTAEQALAISRGQGSGGSTMANLLQSGNRFNNYLKAAELGINVGTGLWAAKSQSNSTQAMIDAQTKMAEDELAYLKEKDAQARADKEAQDAADKYKWELEQLGLARDSEEKRLMWEDTEGRRGPGRTAGYNALSRLNNIHGMGDIGPMPTRSLPVYNPTDLSKYPATTPQPTTPKPHPDAVWDPIRGKWITPPPTPATTSMASLNPATGSSASNEPASYNWMTGRWVGTPTPQQVQEQAAQAKKNRELGIVF